MTSLRTSPDGLTTAEATARLSQFGPNEPAGPPRAAALIQFLRFFANPLVAILLIASFISALLGEVVDAVIISVIVLLSVVLNFIQTYRSQQAADELQRVVTPTAHARRDGAWVEVPRRQIVPGDVIRLAAGDLVPADARLLESRDLHLHESALTGESMPVEKNASVSGERLDLDGGARHMVYLGTSVASGVGTAVVAATGRETALGDIARRLADRPPETEFERGTRAFSLLIMRTVIFLVLFVVAVNLGRHQDPIQTLLFAVALAVGITPEFLPMITSVTLTQGAVHMARRKVIVKHLAAIENFGTMDILCSDKTGTLTSGVMTLERSLDPNGLESERPLALAALNSTFETGITSPLDTAILARAADVDGYHKVDEIPFDFERRLVSVVVERDSEVLLVSKGAPESILARCAGFERDGQVYPFDEMMRSSSEAAFEQLSADGYRVLAVAWRAVPERDHFSLDDERELTLAGYLAFVDPPLPDAAESIRALRAAGVEVKILTGDNELVARHVCASVGIDVSRIVLGDELERTSDTALATLAERTSVFARVSPAQKHRIIMALKRREHVVGYFGDGINDAPSLHSADVGISASGGVEVAREAADIILQQQGLDVLHDGIVEGRRSFGNVLKYILMGTSSNFGNMFSMAGASAFLPFLPMLPSQILLNNFLYDLAQVTIPTDNVDPALIRRPHRWNIGLIRNFMVLIGPISSLYDFLTFFVLLRVLNASETEFHTGWFVESLTTQALVLFVIRTTGNPLRSRPSRPLLVTVLLVVTAGLILPLTPLSKPFGFTTLPATFYLFLVVATGTYLVLVEIVKRRILHFD